MLLISALLTQLSHSVRGKANILCIFILILLFIFHFFICCFKKLINWPQRTFLLSLVHTPGMMKLFGFLISALVQMHGEKG